MVDKLTRKRSVPVHESDGKMRPMCGATLCDEGRVTRWKDMVTCTACLGIRVAATPTGIEVVRRPLGYYVKLPNVWAGEIGLNEQEATELHLLLGSALSEKRDADRNRTELPGAALSDASRGGREDQGQDRAPEARTGNASLPTMGDARRSEDRTSDRGLGMAGSSGGTAAVAVHTCPAGSVSLFHDCGGCIAAFREGGSKRDYPWRTPDGNAAMVTDRGERQAQASPNACVTCPDPERCTCWAKANEASPIASPTTVWTADCGCVGIDTRKKHDCPRAARRPSAAYSPNEPAFVAKDRARWRSKAIRAEAALVAAGLPVPEPTCICNTDEERSGHLGTCPARPDNAPSADSSCEATVEACAKVADEVGQDTLARRIRAMVKAP